MCTMKCCHCIYSLLFMTVFVSVNNAFYASSVNVNPGLKIRISQTGLNYAAQQAVASLSKKAQGRSIPDQHGEADVKVGKVKYDITSMRVTSFSPGTGSATVTSSDIKLGIANVGATVHGDWRYEYKLGFIKIKDHGSFDVTVEGASISLGISVGMDSPQSGRPTIRTTSCSSDVDKVKVKFHGGASWLYNLFNHNVAKALKGALRNTLCDAAQKAINEDGAKQMAKLKVEVPIDNLGVLDYRLVSAPTFTSNYVQSFHKGEVFWGTDQTEAPFSPAPMPDPKSPEKMVTFCMSDYVMNTLGFVANKHGLLNYTLTAKDLPEKNRGVLNTTCNDPVCFGNFLPKAVGQKYPNASISIAMQTSKAPTLNISTAGLHGNFVGFMNYSADLKDGSREFLFSTLATLDVKLEAKMANQKITGNVTDITPKIEVIESAIGKLSGAKLTLMFTFAAKGFIKPKLNEVAQKGLDLPNIDDVAYINPSLAFLQDSLCLQTDVQYVPDNALYYKPWQGGSPNGINKHY